MIGPNNAASSSDDKCSFAFLKLPGLFNVTYRMQRVASGGTVNTGEYDQKRGVETDSAPDSNAHSARQGMAWTSVLAWLWALFCGLSAIMASQAGSRAAFLFYLVCGAMALPPLWRWLQAYGIRPRIRVRATIAVAAIFGAMFAMATRDVVIDEPAKGALAKIADGGAGRTSEVPPRRPVPNAQEQAQRKAKAQELVAAVERFDERDYEGQLTLWNEIVTLVPDNDEYARKRLKIADEVAALEHLRANPEQGIVVEKVRGRREGFGTVLLIDITLRNDSLSDLKDFEITCESKGRSGTVIANNTRSLYDIVQARRTRMFRDVNMGFVNQQATSTSCNVDSAQVA